MKVLWLLSPVLAAALAFLTFLPTLDAAFVNWDDEIVQLAREGHTVEAAGLWREAVPLAPGDPQLLRTLQKLAPALATEHAR